MFIEERLEALLVPSVIPKLYPLIAPDQTPAPYTTYTLFNAQNLTTHDSPLPSTRMWNLQLNTYSGSYGTARSIGNSLSTALIGYSDAFILGITPIKESPLFDDIAKLFCWVVEVLLTENLALDVVA